MRKEEAEYDKMIALRAVQNRIQQQREAQMWIDQKWDWKWNPMERRTQLDSDTIRSSSRLVHRWQTFGEGGGCDHVAWRDKVHGSGGVSKMPRDDSALCVPLSQVLSSCVRCLFAD